jgi:hypothetical protein
VAEGCAFRINLPATFQFSLATSKQLFEKVIFASSYGNTTYNLFMTQQQLKFEPSQA